MPPGPAEPPSLDELRERIEAIDRTLLLLISERVRTARRAIALRQRAGGSPTDAAQEIRVLERSRRWARELGLRPDLAESWVASFVGEGKRSGTPVEPSSTVTVFLDATTSPRRIPTPDAPRAGAADRPRRTAPATPAP